MSGKRRTLSGMDETGAVSLSPNTAVRIHGGKSTDASGVGESMYERVLCHFLMILVWRWSLSSMLPYEYRALSRRSTCSLNNLRNDRFLARASCEATRSKALPTIMAAGLG